MHFGIKGRDSESSRCMKPNWLIIIFLFSSSVSLCAQSKSIDGRQFSTYHSGYFKPHRGIFYSLYFSPVYTVDPLGFGGKSTYGLGLGTQINLWESKTLPSRYSGLKITGLYTAIGFEYYPQQYNKSYLSLWLRIKSIIPLVAKADMVYSRGYGLQGVTYRYCFGFEVKKVTVLLCGETGGPFFYDLGKHPKTESPYANAGAVLLIIPFFNRRER